VTPENLVHYARAHGFVVGSYVKEGGAWQNPLDPGRVAAVARAFEDLAR
jgi:predicted TIM-barrel enzyme